LVAWVRDLPVHVNLILLNPTPAYPERPATESAVTAFAAILDAAGIPHTVRQRRGSAIGVRFRIRVSFRRPQRAPRVPQSARGH